MSRSGQIGRQMKMLHECRASHVLWVIWDIEVDGGIHFLFKPREGQAQGQIRLNFKIQKLLTKTCASCLVLPPNSRDVIYFYVRQMENVKNCVSKK